MRLGIRRKLIGTLMLVGLLPLVISLVVILAGGAEIALREIRARYEDTSAICADQISNTILHEEMEKLVIVTQLPRVDDYVRSRSVVVSTAVESKVPDITPADADLDRRWSGLKPTDPELSAILENEAALRLQLISVVDSHRRHVMLTNTRGQIIAADSKTDDYFQADEEWWRIGFNGGRGKLYVSSITTSSGGVGKFEAGEQVIQIVVPVYADAGHTQLIGILNDELSVTWLLRAMRDIPAAKNLDVHVQLLDLSLPADQMTVYATGDRFGTSSPDARTALNFYLKHKNVPRVGEWTLFRAGLVAGWTPIGMNDNLKDSPAHLFPAAQAPEWVVLVSQSSHSALAPVYNLAIIVAVIGIALIMVLFIMGVAISNREIIMPIFRLREATAAVGRGELNVRVLSEDVKDKTFRQDELGQLARDFDEMTRQLQKNINQLARSNEAKRRFMELAGHELRTPVTYLLGVCQLAQKQLQTLQAMATDGIPEDEAAIALAAKNAAAIASALTKIAARTQRLTRIIDNLLKLVSNDQFTTRMNKAPVDLRSLIMQVVADHRPFIAERKLQMEVDVAEKIPTIDADRDKLEDALTNLLSNAIRFSPEGGKVRIAAHPVVGDMLEILVEDSGPGIPAAEMNNLFEPFYTGEDVLHHTSNERGLGLGLAIVRRFIELHGGIVKAKTLLRDPQSAENAATPIAGTQFQILLPLAKLEPDAAPPANPAA